MQDGCGPSVIMDCRRHDPGEDRTRQCHQPTEILLPNRPADVPSPAAVADGEHPSLLVALAAVPDPRDARGRRYPW